MEQTDILYDTDERIIAGYVNHKSDRAASALVRKFQKFVFSTAYRYFDNYEDADEVTQEVFIKVLTNLHKFKKDSNIKTWIYRITINQCHTYKIKNNFFSLFIRNSQKDVVDIFDRIDNNENVFLTPDTTLENKELEQVFFKALSNLPQKQKETFALRYFENLSYDEISEMLGVTVGALKANYYHATKKIAKVILDYKNEKPIT